MEEVFALALESRRPVGHDAFTLRCSDLAAEICLARLAELAFSALRSTRVRL